MDWSGSFCLLITDARGNVVFASGLPGKGTPSEGAQTGARGSSWRDVLSGLLDTSALPADLPDGCFTCIVPAADGQELRVSFAPLPPHSRGHVILVERRVGPLGSDVQRLHALGMVAAGVAHEINNLLTVASGWLGLLLGDESAGSARHEPLKKVSDAIEQVGELTVNLLDLARAPGDDRANVDVNATVRRIIKLVDYQLVKNDVEPVLDLADQPAVVQGSEGDLAQALLNLILNARDAMPDGGRLFVTTRREEKEVAIEVRDTGTGVPEEFRNRIFDPFFTTRRRSGGTGLGLAVCKEIVERHGGDLTLQSAPVSGAAFTIRLPCVTGSVAIAET